LQYRIFGQWRSTHTACLSDLFDVRRDDEEAVLVIDQIARSSWGPALRGFWPSSSTRPGGAT